MFELLNISSFSSLSSALCPPLRPLPSYTFMLFIGLAEQCQYLSCFFFFLLKIMPFFHLHSLKKTSQIYVYLWQPTPVFLPGESHGQRSLATVHGVSGVGRNLVTTPLPPLWLNHIIVQRKPTQHCKPTFIH